MATIYDTVVDFRTIHNKYLFKRKLKSSSSSDVFQAVERSTNRQVAIRIVQTHFCNNQLRRLTTQLEQEIQLYSQLKHPSITATIESGVTENGLLYIVHEYVSGFTLREVFDRQGALPVERALAISIDISKALLAAHTIGITHGELNPENIVLSQSGPIETVKIQNFPLESLSSIPKLHLPAFSIESDSFCASVYSAPEQHHGFRGTNRSDIYSWGLLLLESLTTSPNHLKVRTRRNHTHLYPAIPYIPPSLSAHPLGKLISSALEEDPNKRICSFEMILQIIQAIPAESVPQIHGTVNN